MMPDIESADPEDNILGDIGSMVANALKVTRNDKRVERLRRQLRLFFNERAECIKRSIVHLIHLVIEQKYRLSKLCIGLDEGLQRFAHHRGSKRSQLGDIHRKIGIGK